MTEQSPNLLASIAISSQRAFLIPIITDRVYARLGVDLHACGPESREKSERDIGYHLNYLTDALWAGEAALFTNYVTWANVLFASLNFSPVVLPTTLEAIRDVLVETLPPELEEISRSYLMMGMNEATESHVAAVSFLEEGQPLSELAHQYLAQLLQGQRHAAIELIVGAVRAGADVRSIYLDVFQPVQREVGRLWQINQISVAQEHYCTAVTQFAMSQLYPYIFSSERKDRRMVATSVGGELHEIGIRMVTDFFELNGWDTYYLGANTPTDSVVQAVVDYNADLVAISATLTPHVQRSAEIIAALKSLQRPPKVIVGGYPFNISPNLWRTVGADATALDAQDAVRIGELLVTQRAEASIIV